MSIKYSLISKENDKVLCEYTDFIGNFEQISRQLLKKVKATFSVVDNQLVHKEVDKDGKTSVITRCKCIF